MKFYAIAFALFVISMLILAFANIPWLGWVVAAGAVGSLGVALSKDPSVVGYY